mgnify:CR=1 FL=1
MKRSVRVFSGKQKKLLYQLFFSYIVFLIVPIFFLSILLNNSVINYSKERITNSNILKLQLLQESIDMYFNEVKNCALSIAHDRRTDNVHVVKRSESWQNYEIVSKVIDVKALFQETWRLRNYIHSIYLYNQDERLIISSTGGLYKAEDFYDTEWIDLIDSIDAFEIYTTEIRKPIKYTDKFDKKPFGIDDSDVITFIFPLKYIKYKGAVAINVRYDYLFKDFISASNDSEANIVVDQNGRIMFDGLNWSDITGIDASEFVNNVLGSNEDHGYYTFFVDEQEYMLTYRKSGVSNLVVINLIKVGKIFDKIFLFRTLLISVSASILVLGLIMSYALSRRIYNPVLRTLEELKNYITLDPKYRKNEISLIHDAVNELLNKERETEKIMSVNKTKLMEAHVTGLIMGRTSEGDSEHPFLEEYNSCFLISIDKYKEFSEKYTIKEQHYYKSVVLSVSNQIVNMYAKGYSAALDSHKIAVIVSLKKEQVEEFKEISKLICDRLFSEMSVVKEFSVSIAIGGLYRGGENIHVSYMEAEKALSYRLFYGNRCCIYHEDIKLRKTPCSYLKDKDNHIINYLKSNSAEDIRGIINEFIDNLKGDDTVNYDSVIQEVMHLVSRTMEHLTTAHITLNDVFEENNNVFLEVMEIETLGDMQKWLYSFYDRIISYQTYHAENLNHKRYIGRVIDIVEKNYMWGDLNLDWICQQLDLSYSHLRKIFKEEIGMNFVDYLNRIRIEHAKELLASTDLTIGEIAEKSGYNNDQCLTRFFKKYEGITPGKYRATIRR